ncbi:potassium-transporting ATPase subunit KdpA [Frankia sp. CNm7]|uniref:Potassium-transporting ATPase potassium-binding subunit n=1 Tax=Frankia nepalensis TaxID=1836974 RepID=A0A937RU35_9ACTN|nr:potassium-transporting ATPase subunit KdpA [Frankia nepalensis]MBL7499992.1 potassium-transporting ATPase subunit KdpA [Frankia nepalensis]MBL7512525.1 potassium-transporting ATPase subunit KdpA [Frankia nepalensis]MBL7517422.1 potassium-transporting ATPase subunit KdpA [Frankia nepalensis]MBL7632828.1 potassium-transporting ATPase subunit KdpA [Frankia nepalensis]
MSTGWAGFLFVVTLVAALCLVYRPVGDYLAHVYTTPNDTRVERALYRVVGVDPRAEQRWGAYLRSVLAFSVVGILFLYGFLRLQHHLLLSLGMPAMEQSQAFNTAISFVTNTNWQSYSGESTVGHLVQMAGLAVQNFVSAAVGMAVAVALVRGFARSSPGPKEVRKSSSFAPSEASQDGIASLGNFWVDVTRGTLRVLLPVSFVFAIVLVAGGAIQNLHGNRTFSTVVGGEQTITGGPVASQEVIKELGTNGGGFYNANSAHPFENPTAWTNWIEIFLMLFIPFCMPRMFGKMVGNTRQGLAIVAVMATLAIASLAVNVGFQLAHHGTVPEAVTAATEGTESRFGVPQSATFATVTTLTSTGAVNSFHDSYTSISGGTLILNMALGEIAPGGVGSGLYGMLILAIVAVFVAGLMIGRTPEYLQKKIGTREIKFASLYLLATPTLVLVGTALAMGLPGERASMLNSGPHGLSEVLYAFTSAANNNGSAFAGISVNTTWYNTALGLAMLFGRFLPIVLVLGLAGSLAAQRPVPVSAGTLPTHRPQFVGMLTGVAVILVALTYFPALALGPLAEGIH